MTEDERTKAAQGIYDAVLNAFPNLRAAMEKAQNDARRQGYVETILGRRRHIPDMQLKPYEFKAGKGYVNPDIDPLDPKTLKNKNDIPERIVRKLEKEFAGYKYKGQIYKRIKQLEEQEHIRVINNTRKIGDATRQCLNCVDSETEILTTSGWKHYNEISIGDTILSFDTEQGYITTDIIEDIIINQGTQSLICFDTPTFNALSTPEHRWVTQESGGRIKIKTTDDIYKHKWPDYPILRSADNQFEDNPKYSDNMLKLLGWIMTDGTIDYKLRHILLYQSTNKPKNLIVYSDMIATLQALGIEYTDRVTENYHSIYLKQCEFKDFVIENFPNRQLSYEFVSSISQRQARIILRAMLQGDGTGVDGNGDAIANKSVSICCGTAEKRDILQYLAFVAGYATNAKAIISSEKDYPSNHIQYASMGNIPVSNSTYYDITILRVKRAHIYPKHKSVVSCDLSWCVTTRNHTWVARRSGKVYITGNSEIQGSAAELTKIAMLKVFNNAEWKSLGGRVINQVHDELIAEIPIRNAERGGEILSRLMSEAGSFLPFTISCDVTTTLRWYGLSYPCEYSKPTSIEVPEQLTESEIAWVQYQLFELEYSLPIHKKEGIKLEGDKALGVDGEWSEAMDNFIEDYLHRYRIDKTEFLDHIEAKVIYDLQKLN